MSRCLRPLRSLYLRISYRLNPPARQSGPASYRRPAAHTIVLAGEPVDLTAKEFALLEYFMRHPGQALRRGRLIEHVWDYAHQGDSNVVDVYVGRLRGKLGEATIETVRGVGYRLCDGEPAAASA